MSYKLSDQLFPIDIGSVEKDHDFLDKDSIQSLFRFVVSYILFNYYTYIVI